MKNVSNFIKSKIEGKSRKNKKYVEYIEDLLKMEEWIKRPPKGMAANICFHALKLQYTKEYLSLLKEMDSEEYEREKDRIFQEKKAHILADEKFRIEEEEAEQEKKKLWLEAGGIE